jgi:hypothetical protein
MNDKEKEFQAAFERDKEIRRILGHNEWEIENGVTRQTDAGELLRYKLEHGLIDHRRTDDIDD